MRNNYILLIIQAMLTLLLFFSEGYVRYTTLALFLLFDLVLFIDILTRKWSYEEVLTFAAIFCSGLFLMFYFFMKSSITLIFGVAVMLLFLVIAMLNMLSKADSRTTFDLKRPEAPEHYYDIEYQPYYDAHIAKKSVPVTPEPVMHVTPERKISQVKGQLTAKAVAYELEKEAQQMKNAERLVKEMEIYNAEKELLKESKELENVQKQFDMIKNAEKAAKAAKQLKKEAKEIMQVQKQINDIQNLQKLQREASAMKKAEKQINDIQNLQKLQREASAMKKAEKQINDIQNLQKLQREASAMKKAEKQINDIQNLQKLQREASAMKKAEKQINDVKNLQKLQREASAMKKAEKQIQEIQFLDQQEKIVKQAKAIAKAQKDIDTLKDKKQPKPVSKPASVIVKTVKAVAESFYFATETGNKFHEPGCMAIKKVPKNKLILYTSKKEAMKKGLQSCSVCIPK